MPTNLLRVFISLLLTVGVAALHAQNCDKKVSGYVFDRSTGEPLSFVTVQIENKLNGTSTDLNGFFEITGICGEEVHLVISMVGYKTIIHHHDIYHPSPQIFLANDAKMLESIIVEEDEISSEFLSLGAQALVSKDIEKLDRTSFADLAANLSGVSTISTGQNVVKPVIHGLHSNRILIINNELRHEFQNWGIEHAPEIDPTSIEHLEVVKGAAAVKYGPDALGGVILVRDGSPRLHDAFYGQTSHQYQTNGRGLTSHMKIGWGGERWAIQSQGSVQRFGDQSAPDYVLTNTGKFSYNVGAAALYHGANLDLEAEVTKNHQQLGILRGSVTGNLNDLVFALNSDQPVVILPFDYEIKPPYQDVDHLLAKVKASYRKANHLMTMLYGYQKNHRQEIDIRRGSTTLTPSIDLELSTHTLDLEWRLPAGDNWTLSLGSQSLIQDNNNLPGTNTVPFVPNFNNYRTGIFGVFALIQKNYTVEGGLRYDYQYSSVRGRLPNNDIFINELNFSNLTGSVGLIKPLNARNSLRFNFGNAWRPPNVSELYSFGKHQNAFEYGLWRYRWTEQGSLEAGLVLEEDDRSLNPEIGSKAIGVWNYSGVMFNSEVGIYANWIQNYLFTRPAGLTNTVRGAFPYFIFDQTTAFLTGVDFDLDWKHSELLSSRISSSFVYARDLDNDSFFLNMPPANIRHQLDWKVIDRQHTQVLTGLENQWVARQIMAPEVITPQQILNAYENQTDIISSETSPFDIAEAPNRYWVTGTYVSVEKQQLSVRLRVNNLWNATYRIYTDRLRYFADQIGRDLSVQINYQW